MADGTKIEWTEASWTPIRALLRANPARVGWHCEHASPGCLNCYSETFNRDRLGTRLPYKPGHRKDVEIFVDEKMLTQPLRWRRPRQIFVCSMTDLFGEFVTDEMIDRVFAVMALCPQHTFQVLTKRSARMHEYVDQNRWQAVLDEQYELQASGLRAEAPVGDGWPLPNVWLGVSVEDQQRADERIPDLLATPAAIRWLSCEPLLGPVDLRRVRCARGDTWDEDLVCDVLTGASWTPRAEEPHYYPETLNWIVAGGESGPGARPMQAQWARSLRDQCQAAAVPFFFKQWGSHRPTSDVEHGEYMIPATKRDAGRLLDGVEHNGMPEMRT